MFLEAFPSAVAVTGREVSGQTPKWKDVPATYVDGHVHSRWQDRAEGIRDQERGREVGAIQKMTLGDATSLVEKFIRITNWTSGKH